MRFEIAVAVVLAAERMSSSEVTAEGSLSALQERAKLRKEAIEAFSNRSPKEHRRLRHPAGNLFQDRMHNIPGDSLRELRSTVQEQYRQLNKKKRNLGGDDIDLGIFPTKTRKKELIKKKALSSIQRLQSKKATIGNPGPKSQSTFPDLETKKNKDRIKTLVNVLNPNRGSSSDRSLPDLGIIAKESESKGETHAEKDNRRLDDSGSFDSDALLASPIAYAINSFCITYGALYSENCDVCRVEFSDEGDTSAGYSLYVDCVALAPEVNNLKVNMNYFCSLGLCESGCEIDSKNFKFEMKECAITNIEGLQEQLSDIGFDTVDDLKDFADIFGVISPLLDSSSPLAQQCVNAAQAPSNTDYCKTCEVTYLDEIGDITPYDINYDCSNRPDGVFEAEFENFCSYGVCQTCEFDAESVKFELKNCSFSFLEYEDVTFEDIDDDTSDPFNPYGSYINTTELAAYTLNGFQEYFGGICDSDDFVCGKCGPSSLDNDSIFSFELDCPAVIDLQKAEFGSYVRYAQYFCNRNNKKFGLNCSTCEVNPFDTTININDCSLMDGSELYDMIYNNNFEYDEFATTYTDETSIFSQLYYKSCVSYSIYDYLQDELESYTCTCAFNRTTKTASFSCESKETCNDFPSYCKEPLEMCAINTVSTSLINDTLSIQRCINASFGSAGDYQFTYCINHGTAVDVVNSTAPKNGVGCEMEVQGIRCNSCSIGMDSTSFEEGRRFDSNDVLFVIGMGDAMDAGLDILYNCSNTVIGATGIGKKSEYQLLDDTLAYYAYKVLPCSGGCDLCGDGESQFMSKPDGVFATEKWKDNEEDTCFPAQLEAMTLKQPLTDEECQQMRDVVREPCGCKNLNPPSSANSFGKGFSTMSSIVLTIAAASVVQMLLG